MSTPFRLPPRKSNAPAQPAQPDAQHGFLEFVTCALCLTPYDGNNDDGDRRWFMTSCGYILCDDPIHKHRRNTCTLCGRHGATFYPIDDQLSPELHQWFQPSLSHFDAVTSSIGVLRFQNSQLTAFVRSLKETVAEQKSTMNEAAEQMTLLSDKLEESERRVQKLSQQLSSEQTKVDNLRDRNAALEQQLASYGSIGTPPVSRPRVQHLMPQPAGPSRLTPRMQHAELGRLRDRTQPAMSPLTAHPQLQFAVPSAPMPQRNPRGRPPSAALPEMQPQQRPQPRPPQMDSAPLYNDTQGLHDYTEEQEPADYPAKRSRFDQNNQPELLPSNRYARASTIAPHANGHTTGSEPGPTGRPHSSASFGTRPRSNLDQYRFVGDQGRSQPAIPRRAQMTPSSGHRAGRGGYVHGTPTLGAIEEDDERLQSYQRM